MNPLILVLIFVAATIIGYFLIKNVPPLMSGMNALSGVTIIGALAAAGLALLVHDPLWGQVLGALAIILATINVVGGFGVTHRMLRMFQQKKKK